MSFLNDCPVRFAFTLSVISIVPFSQGTAVDSLNPDRRLPEGLKNQYTSNKHD